MSDRYTIVRFYRSPDVRPRVIAEGVSLVEAQAHTNDPETSSATASGVEARVETEAYGAWFDGHVRADDDGEV